MKRVALLALVLSLWTTQTGAGVKVIGPGKCTRWTEARSMAE